MNPLVKKFLEKYFFHTSSLLSLGKTSKKNFKSQGNKNSKTGFRSPAPFARMLVNAGGEAFLLIAVVPGMLLMDLAKMLGIKTGDRFGDAFAAAGCMVLILSPYLIVVGGLPGAIYLLGQAWHHLYLAAGRKLKVYVTLEQIAQDAGVELEWAGWVVKGGTIEPVDSSLENYVTGKPLHFASKDGNNIRELLESRKNTKKEKP